MTCIYEEITWQANSIKLYEEYCDRNNIDFVLITKDYMDDSLWIYEPCMLKYYSMYKARDSEYDNIMFVDADTFINPNSCDVFSDFKGGLSIRFFPVSERYAEQEFLEGKEWKLYEFLVIKNILGDIDYYYNCWGTLYMFDRKTLADFLDYVEIVGSAPKIKNKKTVEGYSLIDHHFIGQQRYEFTDQVNLSLFMSSNRDICNHHHWEHSVATQSSQGDWTQFLDFYDCDNEEDITREMNKWVG